MTADDRLAELMLTWEDAKERGENVNAKDLCRDCPDLLDALLERIRLLENAGWLKSSSPRLEKRLLAGRYRLDVLLGEGGYGQVWRAFDEELQRPVALKVPKPTRKIEASQIDQLLDEARRVARLRHPGIVTVHDVVKEGAGYFIVSDLIDGSTLAERLGRGKLPVEETVKLVAQVARIIDYAHRQGVVHRDLKPANIFLDAVGQPHVGDFGIARSQEELLDGNDRRGTLAYAAPEQLEGKPLDGRADIWSLGIILYEMLAGHPPFRDENPVQLQQKILSASFPTCPGIPAALLAICRRCVSRNPEDRFASGHDLAAALDDSLRSKKWPRWPVSVGVLGIALSAGIVWIVWSWLLAAPPLPDDSPTTTYVGTRRGASNWAVSGGGASESPAFPYGGLQQEISITDNGGSSGKFVLGGSLDKFNGFWTASRRFRLPANADSVVLTFSNFRCDDRGVLLLNGTTIGNYSSTGSGPNAISLPPGPPDVKFHFTNTTSGTVDHGFVLGEDNVLFIVVNNAKGGPFGATCTFLGPSDGTHAGVDATVTFTLPK